MFAKRRDISKELTELINATKDLPRGSFIPHEDIEAASGMERNSAHWNVLVKKWKGAMGQRGLWIKAAVPLGTGYRILTLDEQREREPATLEKQAMRRLNRAAMCLGTIPAEDLTEEQRAFQAARLGQFAERKKIQQEHQAQAASWLSNPKTLPKFAPPKLK